MNWLNVIAIQIGNIKSYPAQFRYWIDFTFAFNIYTYRVLNYIISTKKVYF